MTGLQSGMTSANAKSARYPNPLRNKAWKPCVHFFLFFFFTNYNSCDQLIQEITQFFQFTKSKYDCFSKNANLYELISLSRDIMGFFY